jgi:hypothetical protein
MGVSVSSVPGQLPIAEMMVLFLNFQDDLAKPLSPTNLAVNRIGLGIPLGRDVTTAIAFTFRQVSLSALLSLCLFQERPSTAFLHPNSLA